MKEPEPKANEDEYLDYDEEYDDWLNVDLDKDYENDPDYWLER